MQTTKFRPGKDHAVTVDEEILRAHSTLKGLSQRLLPQLVLCFRRRRNLLFRFGLGLWYLPSDRRGLGRHFLAIQISDATSTFHSDPMLLTHEAFYRTERVSTQCEIKRWRTGRETGSRAEKTRNSQHGAGNQPSVHVCRSKSLGAGRGLNRNPKRGCCATVPLSGKSEFRQLNQRPLSAISLSAVCPWRPSPTREILSFMLARIPDPTCTKSIRVALLFCVAMTLASCATKEPPPLIADPAATRETALPWNEQQKWEQGGPAAEQINTATRR